MRFCNGQRPFAVRWLAQQLNRIFQPVVVRSPG